MAIRVWRSNYGLGTIYAELDKSKTSIMDLTQKVFDIAKDFGFVTRIEVTTETAGDDAFVESINLQKEQVFQPIEKMNITTESPTKDFIAFIEEHHDVCKLYFYLSTTGVDEHEQTILLGGAVLLIFYLYPDEEWGMNIFINTDIFVPFYRKKDGCTEAMARANSPILKQLLENCLTIFPVTDWEWQETLPHMEEYLELSVR
jgi:hypothetical protein